jgi:hypothetical protein
MRDDYVLWHCNWHKAHWPCCAPPQYNLPFVSFTLNVNSLTGSLERGPFTHPLLSLAWFSIGCSRGSECGLGNFEMKREFFSSVIWDTLEVRDFSCKTVSWKHSWIMSNSFSLLRRVLRTLYKILYLQILDIIPPFSMVEYSSYRFLFRRHSCHQLIWIASSTKM